MTAPPLIFNGLCDSHTHLMEMKKKEIPLEDLLPQLDAQGMGWLMDAGVDVDDFQERLQYKSYYPRLIFAAGIHPGSCRDEEQLVQLEPQLDHPDVHALGEIGLDYYWKKIPRDLQITFFREQLRMAKAKNLPVIIHNRDADDDVYPILQEEQINHGVMHCYGGGEKWLKPCLDLGFYVSFAGNVSYKSASKLRKAAALVPSDRLLVETDAPYLAAQEVRGRRNHPGFLGYTLQFLADLRDVPVKELTRSTAQNFADLFGVNL